MGEHSKAIGQGVSCGYCGETTLGVEAKPVKTINFDDVYFDEALELDERSLKPIAAQIGEYVLQNIEPEMNIVCPSCKATSEEEDGDIFSGELWECTDCGEQGYTDEDEAEDCCSYNRRYAQQNQQYERERVDQMRRELEAKGYHVSPPIEEALKITSSQGQW
jgi:hypothetical protein